MTVGLYADAKRMVEWPGGECPFCLMHRPVGVPHECPAWADRKMHEQLDEWLRSEEGQRQQKFAEYLRERERLEQEDGGDG